MTFFLDVSVASKSNKQKKLEKRRKYQEPDPDPLVRGADPARTKKMSRIRNTAFKIPIIKYRIHQMWEANIWETKCQNAKTVHSKMCSEMSKYVKYCYEIVLM
jgi:hypothetical protein